MIREAAIVPMTGPSAKRTAAVKTWLAGPGQIARVARPRPASGRATGPLAKRLDAVGATLEPKGFRVAEPADQGAGPPHFDPCTAKQMQYGSQDQSLFIPRFMAWTFGNATTGRGYPD